MANHTHYTKARTFNAKPILKCSIIDACHSSAMCVMQGESLYFSRVT